MATDAPQIVTHLPTLAEQRTLTVQEAISHRRDHRQTASDFARILFQQFGGLEGYVVRSVQNRNACEEAGELALVTRYDVAVMGFIKDMAKQPAVTADEADLEDALAVRARLREEVSRELRLEMQAQAAKNQPYIEVQSGPCVEVFK